MRRQPDCWKRWRGDKTPSMTCKLQGRGDDIQTHGLTANLGNVDNEFGIIRFGGL